MIDVIHIRSLKTLEEMREILTEFLTNPEVKSVYLEDHEWGEEDYDADRESVELLRERVEHRIKSLGHHLNKPKVTASKSVGCRQSSGEKVPQEASSVS